jgi:hypothetical protein
LAWGGGFDGHIEWVSKSTYGCDSLLCPADQLEVAIGTHGYAPENILVPFQDSTYPSLFDSVKSQFGVSRFYLDEPVHRNALALLAAACVHASAMGCHVYTSECDGQEDWWGLLRPSHVKFLASFVSSMPPSQRPFVGCHTYFKWEASFTQIPEFNGRTYASN